MRGNIPSLGRGNKILPAILIVANIFMLMIGIITIPPNLRSGATTKKPPVTKAEQTVPATPPQEEEFPPVATEAAVLSNRRKQIPAYPLRKKTQIYPWKKHTPACPQRNAPI